jgi:hypothetical protein
VRAGAPLPNLSEQQHGDVLLQVNRTGSQQEALERYRNRISFDSSYGDDDMYVDFNPGRPVTRSRQSISLYDSVKSYWPIFLLKHQHPANVAMHCFAFVLMYAIAGVALIQHKYWMLLLMPLSQGTGLLGHWLFEPTPIDQRDTIFSWRAFASLHLMFFSVLTGRYSSQLTQAQILVLRNSLNRSSSIQPARTTTCSKPQ